MSTTLVLLAAGLSRRMGCDKLLLNLNGQPLYLRALALMAQFPQAKGLVVSNTREILDAAHSRGYAAIQNPLAHLGMGTSVAAAARRLDTDCAVFLNGDQPALSRNCLEKLLETAARTAQIVVPRAAGQSCSPCVFPRR